MDIVQGLGGIGLFYKYDSNNNIIGTYNGGGAISCLSDSTLQINNLNITDNNADYGGGILSINDCELNIENSHFENNEATINGGALYGYSTDVFVNNTTFMSNISDTDPNNFGKGGAIHLGYSTLYPVNSSISDSTFITTVPILGLHHIGYNEIHHSQTIYFHLIMEL